MPSSTLQEIPKSGQIERERIKNYEFSLNWLARRELKRAWGIENWKFWIP